MACALIFPLYHTNRGFAFGNHLARTFHIYTWRDWGTDCYCDLFGNWDFESIFHFAATGYLEAHSKDCTTEWIDGQRMMTGGIQLIEY